MLFLSMLSFLLERRSLRNRGMRNERSYKLENWKLVIHLLKQNERYMSIVQVVVQQTSEINANLENLPSPVLDKISENRRNIYESNQINQTILEIDFDRTTSNESGRSTYRSFGISKYYQYSIFRNTFQCHYARITETIILRSY